MSKLEKLRERARTLEAKDPKGAIEAWLEILKEQDSEAEPNPDLSIFNRIGDLYLKIKDPAQAADYYDRAVDAYAELGFHNNAIAMCNKVLRNAPGRQNTYLKLAKLYASKGFMGEAKQNFVEYAERMHRGGKIQHAFAALKEIADLSPEAAHLRQTLEEHLRMYGAPERRPGSGTGDAASPPIPTAADDLSKSGKRKSSRLVFLDVDAPSVPKGAPGSRLAPLRPTSPPLSPPSPPTSTAPAAPKPPPPPAPEPEPAMESLIEPVAAEPDSSLEIESTNLVEGLESTNVGGTLEGFETTSTEFGDIRLAAGEVPSLRDEVTADDVAPLADLEPTVADDAVAGEATGEIELEPLPEAELEIESPAAPPPVAPKQVRPPATPVRPGVGSPSKGGAGVGMPKLPKLEPPSPGKVKPVVPRRPAPPAPESTRKPVVEVPPLELEPDFDTTTEGRHDVDDEPLVIEADPPVTRGPRRSAAIDLGLDGVVTEADDAGPLAFENVEQRGGRGGGGGRGVARPTIEDLEARVADDPDDPDAHQGLGEALIEAGERERGIEELDHATTGFENRGNLSHAQDLVDEVLRLDPNSVRHRQKQVEFAFKSGDKVKLIEAYLELADTLLRSDLPDKARAVYQRVAEHDPTNERAKAALSMLAPVAPAPPAPKSKGKTAVREEKTPARDAKMRVRDEVGEDGDFVDLSAMIFAEDLPERDTRMKVADEEPTGDEERDFQEMLTRFKQGIDENIDEGDFQSHYDLGVAFKEMGLLDEAIAELQKALRSPEGKLRSSEALGVCFIEKGAHVVAESILRRALELPASGDQERLGILYWLARALEEQGKRVEARELYGRVFAVDIRFRDVGERAKALAKAK